MGKNGRELSVRKLERENQIMIRKERKRKEKDAEIFYLDY